VLYDVNGERHRPLAEAVALLDDMSWEDSPVHGLVTMVWRCRFIKDKAGTPTAWHVRWVAVCRLQPSAAGFALHELACKMLELMVCYNQLQIVSVASAELPTRPVQDIEQHWKDRVVGNMSDHAHQSALFSGLRNLLGLCIDAKVTQSMVGRPGARGKCRCHEQRKAREERGMAKPKKDP